MKRTTTLTLALIIIGSLTFASEVFADHTRTVRRVYEANRIDLEHDYKARRKENTYAYHRERDALRAARSRAARIDCPDTRSRRVRAINRDLVSLSRDYNARNRELSTWYHNGRKTLRTEYEVSLRRARLVAARPVIVETVSSVHAAHPADCSCNVCVPVVEPVVVERPVFERPVVYERPVVVERYERTPTFAHRADCGCHICEPPAPVIETCPNVAPRFERGYGDRHEYRDYRDRDFRDDYGRGGYAPASYRRTPTLDWASLILNLVN